MLTKKEIQRHIKDIKWQRFRLSLKGLSTQNKLKQLQEYKRKHPGRAAEVQIENYLNALKRGGLV